MKYIKPNNLYCFSPPVMLATFFIEIFLAGYTLWRYKMSTTTRLAAAILVCLAVFQLAEFNVCENAQLLDSAAWARLGYVAITLLPPLGIHLISKLSDDKRHWPYVAAYAFGGLFTAYFLLATSGIAAGVCLGNYVIFEQASDTAYLYGFYYYGLLIAAIMYALYRASGAKAHIKRSLYALSIGYALFMIPTTLVNIINPSTMAGIPSIMCGFAVLLALVLAGKVLPHYYERTAPSAALMKFFRKK